jgi:sugar-specific transcriptional regulator TrmB
MYNEIFQDIGLSPNEAKIYETLLLTGVSGVGDISTHANIHRRNVYDALQRLTHKGLVFVIFQKGENRYSAVNPDKLMELLKEKERSLQQILPNLHTIYETDPPEEAAFIYKGIEGYKNYMRDLVRVGEDTLFLGAKGLWYTPGIDDSFLKDFKQMAKKKKMHYRTIYDPRVPEELPQALKNVGGEYKVLPKGYETNGVCDIFGDYVVTFTSEGIGNFGEDGVVYVMINKQLADSYRTWFQFMWDMCPVFTKKP